MKLKTKLIILALFTLILLTCSCVSAEEVSAEEDMSFDDTLSVDEAADEISEGNTVYISPNGQNRSTLSAYPLSIKTAIKICISMKEIKLFQKIMKII